MTGMAAMPMETADTRRWDVLAFGNPCADLVLQVDALPARGCKVVGWRRGVLPGGTEANVACAVARLGRMAAIHGRLGGDAFAPLLQRSFDEFGVDTRHLVVDTRLDSACAVTLVQTSGERSIVYAPMAATRAGPLEPAVGQARIVYSMPYGLEDFIALSETARRHSTLVAIDVEAAVAPEPAAMWARVVGADIVFFNEEGFRAGTGQCPGPQALEAVRRAGPRTVVVSLGAAGAMAVDRDGFARQAAFPCRVADTTGAGDSFNAAFLVALLDGLPLQAALRFACAAASCTVAAIGARAGLPDLRQVQAVLAAATAG